MKKEIYDSLFNRTFEDMTSEDYKLYNDLLLYRDRKILHITATSTCLLAPWLMIGGAGLALGTFSASFICGLAGFVSGVFTLVFGTAFNPNILSWWRDIKKFVKSEFTKEDLKLMKKEKIYKKLYNMCAQFEKTDKYEAYLKNQDLLKNKEGEVLSIEEQIAKVQERRNELDATLEELKQQQKREKTNKQVSEVFTGFEETDDTKGL